VFIALCALLSVAFAANWGVLVAGSNQYYNYRHQADVCHAYHVLSSNGIDDDHIIMLYYDDIANNPQNPFPGKLYNHPATGQGIDVYAGCKKDYTGNDVTAANFLCVLTGNSSCVAGAGDGKVLKSTANDDVFVFFSDHGGTGIIAFPVGPFLQATDMNAALEYMAQKKMYKKLVFYLEACESGSMFQNLLPPNINIYATSASSPYESSWGCYCPPDDMVNGQELNSCLGDLYSVNWMEDADKAGAMKETLQVQYTNVKTLTTQSQVMQWGETDWTGDIVGHFEGNVKAASKHTGSHAPSSKNRGAMVDSRDAKLNHLYWKYLRSQKKGTAPSVAAARELQAEIDHRAQTDAFFYNFARTLTGVDLVDKMVSHHIGSPVSCGHCCKDVMEMFRTECGGWSDYALKYTRTVVNVCEHLRQSNRYHHTEFIMKTMRSMCSLQ